MTSSLRAILVASIASLAYSFAPPSQYRPTTAVFSSDNENDGGIADFEKERMNIVRNLQKSYYSDAPGSDASDQTLESAHSAATLDPATGIINNLPLWRVGWVETPGRRNCLNVHEMQYTHMFEKILAQSGEGNDGPLYFGHLYLPGGTKAAKSGEERYQLKTWREELEDANRFDNYDSSSTTNTPDISTPTVDRSAVVGCLMQIIDHRRMEDGKLMILTQAVERFVVEEIVDTKPYSVANVQILLDREELSWEKKKNIDDKSFQHLRGKAVESSFCYHDYEFDRPKLPVSGKNVEGDENFVTSEDVPWTAISKLLPFAHYSTNTVCLDAANEKAAHVDTSTTLEDNGDNNISSGGVIIPMEQELRNGGITWDPPPVPQVIIRRSQDTDCDTLETLLWLALDDFCQATGFELPQEIRCLLPPAMDYLDISTDVYLSSNYPKLRRQRRLSYLAPALIENLEIPMKGMRQVWLNTPSTSARLMGALERYDYLNNKLMGNFE